MAVSPHIEQTQSDSLFGGAISPPRSSNNTSWILDRKSIVLDETLTKNMNEAFWEGFMIDLFQAGTSSVQARPWRLLDMALVTAYAYHWLHLLFLIAVGPSLIIL
jgi:hypothetical protein